MPVNNTNDYYKKLIELQNSGVIHRVNTPQSSYLPQVFNVGNIPIVSDINKTTTSINNTLGNLKANIASKYFWTNIGAIGLGIIVLLIVIRSMLMPEQKIIVQSSKFGRK
jgi:hypothetical protein